MSAQAMDTPHLSESGSMTGVTARYTAASACSVHSGGGVSAFTAPRAPIGMPGPTVVSWRV